MGDVKKKIMTLNFDDHFCPANDVMFAVMFGHKNLFCRLNNAVHQRKIEIDGEPHTQANMREDDVLLNTILFDVFAEGKSEQNSGQAFYSMDMQRKYYHTRLTRRSVYYVCRVISKQPVKRMKYEGLKPVHISFVLTEKDAPKAVRHVGLCYTDTGEPYDDLIDLILVYVPAVVREADKDSDLYVFSRFFAVESEEAARAFVKEFENNELAKELVTMYNVAVSNKQNLFAAENSPYFAARLTEEEMEEERQEAKREGEKKGKQLGIYEQAVKTAMEMLAYNEPIDKITKYTKLDIGTIRSIMI